MSRMRWVLLLVVLAGFVTGLAVLAVADPIHLRHARWFTAGLVLLAVVAATAACAVAVRTRRLRVAVAALGGAAALGWAGLVFQASQLAADNRDLSSVAEGDRRLVVVEGATAGAGPVYAVVVRSGGGPFEQESVVYQGVAGVPAPAVARFVDAGTVEVAIATGCRYRSQVRPGTLAADPVHRPLHPGGC